MKYAQSQPHNISALDNFASSLREKRHLAADIHAGQIGAEVQVPGPFGAHKMVYADYVASGRALWQVENFVQSKVLPYYANSHTESSYCGNYTTALRQRAREIIRASCGGNSTDHALIFTGSGATGALNKLVHLFGIRETVAAGRRPTILVGPYEHHSNLLPWRESGARVIEINEAETGGPDLDHLAGVLNEVRGTGPIIAAFSAASNVTGIVTEITAPTRMVKQSGGLMVWDFAGGGPYLSVNMTPSPGVEIDAVALSPHKFIGGPGASGVLVVRRDAVAAKIPGAPGGGTVAFVNKSVHDYSPILEEREEGGTPNIIGDIRAALAILVKDAIGQEFITDRNQWLSQRAADVWRGAKNLNVLGGLRADGLPILSFTVTDHKGGLVDHAVFTRMLSDFFGIQARGGCACAGPYVHRLLNIDDARSAHLRREILAGDDSQKPGFIRLNLSYLMDDGEVAFILNSVLTLASDVKAYRARYQRPDGLATE